MNLIQTIAILFIIFVGGGVIPNIFAHDFQHIYAYSPDKTIRASWKEIRFEEDYNPIVIIENFVESQWIKVQELNLDSRVSWIAFSNNEEINELVLQIVALNFRTTWRLIDGQWIEYQKKSLASIIDDVKNRKLNKNLLTGLAGTGKVMWSKDARTRDII